jgi:hypothetical protein
LGSIESHSSDSKSTENPDQKTHGFHYLVDVGYRESSCFASQDAVRRVIFCAFVLLDIEENLCDGKRRRTLQGVCLHLDNAPAHNAKWLRQEITRTKATRVVHRVYSPDAAPSNFFLFSYLKGETAGFTANSFADILSDIRRIFQEISKEIFVAVHDKWITRLE